MVNLSGRFDPTTPDDEEPSSGGNFPLIPPGRYLLHMIEGSRAEADENDQKYTFVANFEIIDGQYKTRRVRHFFNLFDASGNHSKFFDGQLKKLCKATGVMSQQLNSDDLLHKPFIGNVLAFPAGATETNKKTGAVYTYQKDTNKFDPFDPFLPPNQMNAPVQQRQPQAPQGGVQQPARAWQAPQQAQAPAAPTGPKVGPWARKPERAAPF